MTNEPKPVVIEEPSGIPADVADWIAAHVRLRRPQCQYQEYTTEPARIAAVATPLEIRSGRFNGRKLSAREIETGYTDPVTLKWGWRGPGFAAYGDSCQWCRRVGIQPGMRFASRFYWHWEISERVDYMVNTINPIKSRRISKVLKVVVGYLSAIDASDFGEHYRPIVWRSRGQVAL